MPSEQLQTAIEMLRSRPTPKEFNVDEQRANLEQLASLRPGLAGLIVLALGRQRLRKGRADEGDWLA